MELTSSKSPAEVAKDLVDLLDARSQDVVKRRYGLETGKPETLESIGQEYGITRERVRQIQAQAKKTMIDSEAIWQATSELLNSVFSSHGGVLTEQHAVEAVREHTADTSLSAAVVLFYLDVLDPYKHLTRHSHFDVHWRHPEYVSDRMEVVVETAKDIAKGAKHPLPETEFISLIREKLGADEVTLPDRYIIAALVASKDLDKTAFGEWGLTSWSETRPRGVGDKAYIVLRRCDDPQHFMRITEMINEASFDHKTANPQTVHNELIKDDRFVLVGRGLYGLSEWGFVSGTVADVIEDVLKKAGRPLSKDEILDGVLAQRQVKKNTILLGLQNEERFNKTDDDKFEVKA